jgi:hypothetical protein
MNDISRPWNKSSRGYKQNHLKINLEKCIFGNKEVSYLGFTLTPEGIKPSKNKLKAIETAKTPADVKTIRSFVGLCNFFRTHIKNFAIVAAPLFKLTRKDSGYKGGPLPEEAKAAFVTLRKQLISEPVMAFPRLDRQYVDHRCSHRHRRDPRRPRGHPYTSGQGGQILRHFLRVPPAQGS